jgi:hypothetical protein
MAQFQAFLSSRDSWKGKSSDKHSSIVVDKPLCQLCFKKGRIADQCYKWFDSTYKPPPPLRFKHYQQQQSYQYPNKSPSQYQPQPQALFVQPGTTSPDAWYMNSGASAHVAPDLNAFTTYCPYDSSDKL